MEKTGTLKIANHESKVNGTLLARETDDQDEFGAATEFMINNNCDDGDCVTITGRLKGGAFWVDTAKKVDSSLCAGPVATAEFSAAVAKSAGRVLAKKKAAKKSPPAKKTEVAESATSKPATVPKKQKKVAKKGSNKKGKRP